MKKITFLALSLVSSFSMAQHSGNVAYENNDYDYNRNYNNLYNRVVMQTNPNLPNDSTYLLDAKVLINIQPDAYIAVFAVQQEAQTAIECNKLITTRIDKFISALGKTGIKAEDIFVDMIAQAQIYDFDVQGNVASEYKKGFEFKKNVVIKFTDNKQLDKISLLAAEQEIFDLVKVDYIILDIEKVQNQLREAALLVLQNKKKFVNANSSLSLDEKGIIQFEQFNTVYPQESYRKYVAAETARAQPYYFKDNQAWVKEQRKSQTFYFEKLHPGAFDKVINPAAVMVPIQMTLTIGYKYDI